MLSFFPLDVFDEIWDLVGSVSEGFPSYSFNPMFQWLVPGAVALSFFFFFFFFFFFILLC